jgi:phosphoglycolate phosphatase
VNAALCSCGFPPRTKAEVQSFVGNGIKLLMARSLPQGFDNPRYGEALEHFKQYYGAHCCDHTKPYFGVMELLQKLKEGGRYAAIVSNKADFAIKELAKQYFDGLIDVAIGENEEAGIGKKPAPDSVFAAMAQLGTKGEETLYIGDSEVDIETARNARLACASVTWGFKTEQFLKEHGASVIVRSPEELLNL